MSINNLKDQIAIKYNNITDYLESCTYFDPISSDHYLQDITPDRLQELCCDLGASISELLALEASGKELVVASTDQIILHHYDPL